MYPHLKPGYTVRSPTESDIPAIISIMRAFDIAETGEADAYEPEDVLADWSELNVTTDSWVVIAPEGLLCGYATLTVEEAGRIFADGYTHPAHYGCGIGTTLVTLMEQRAQEIVLTLPEGMRLVLVNNIVASSVDSRTLLERQGYTLARVYFRMHITLDTLPEVAPWPERMTVRTCDGSPEDIYRVYETIQDVFKDHWAHPARTFENWRKHLVREEFDPTLWFVLQDGDQIVGVALCRVREPGQGWVTQIGIRRAWRRRGLGMALLQHAFAAFYKRNVPRVGLGVDGQSLTGAQRLYERAGMKVTMYVGRYEKELRAGNDLLADQNQLTE